MACIKEGRSAFQRVLTYTLTILVNKCVTLIVLGAGLIITGHAVLTPLLQALSMLTNDFVTMARGRGPSAAVGLPQRLARPKPDPRRRSSRLIPAALSGRGSRAWVGAALHLSPERDADPHFRHARCSQARETSTFCATHGRFWRSRPAPIFCYVATTLLFTLATDSHQAGRIRACED